MNDMNTGTSGAPATRPTLLTVLCILSFIAAAWGIIGGIINLSQAGNTDQAMQEAQQKMEEAKAQLGDQANGLAGSMMDSGMEVAQKAAENAKPMAITGIVLSLLSLLGVWQMWNLRKAGFWLYLLAAVAGLITPMIFLGGGMIALLSVGFMGLISILFIILYAVNLKYMH